MDFKTCKCILTGRKGSTVSGNFSEIIVFRTFKVVVEKVVGKLKGNWAQLLLDFDFQTIEWDFNKFQNLLLLFSSLSLFSDHTNFPCSVTTVLHQPYVKELCDTFLVDLVSGKEWTPLQWRAVLNMSRVVSLSTASKNLLVLYSLDFMNSVPDVYEDKWIRNCPSFCNSVSTAGFLFIETYQTIDDLTLFDKHGFLKTLISVVCYFESYKLGTHVERGHTQASSDDCKVPSVQVILPMVWSTGLVDKLTRFCLQVFRQHYMDGITVPLDHALLGLDCPSAPVQSLSLLLVLCHLRATAPSPLTREAESSLPKDQKNMHDAKVIKANGKGKEKGKLRGKAQQVRNILKLEGSAKKGKSPQARGCEVLSQSGQIRKVYWCLLSRCSQTRTLAMEVLSTFESILQDEKSESGQQCAWQSYLIEQGVVPLIELIACGFPIASIGDSTASEQKNVFFPEQTICTFADSMLQRLSTSLVEDMALQEKIFLSLVHTKNTFTRGNIFSGLLFLSPRSASISQIMMQNSKGRGGSDHSSVFGDLLSELYHEESLSDLKKIVKLIYHFFQIRNKRVGLMLAKSKQLDIHKKEKDGRKGAEKLALSTEILVKDKFNGSLVKMKCPDMRTLKSYSRSLELLLENVSSPSAGSREASLSVLPGHYHIWQELFSHMIDDYVMETSLSSTGVVEILELFQYSCQYEIPHLCMQYAKELANRLSTESFPQIFQGSISEVAAQDGESGRAHPTPFDLVTFPYKLSLCCHCLRFLIDKTSKVATPHHLQRKLIISTALDQYFQFVLLSQ